MKSFSLACVTLFVLFSSEARAQDQFVQVKADFRVDTLIARNIAVNKAVNGIPGYRIQIFFGSERKAANDARVKFLELFPNEEVYMMYQQPYFKVRTGDFRTRLDALPMLRELVTHFNKVFIVPDKINFPKL